MEATERFPRRWRRVSHLTETRLCGPSLTSLLQILQAQQKIREEIEAHPDAWFRFKVEGRWKRAADTIADWLKAPHGSIVFVQNATTGANSVIRSPVPWKAIISTSFTYGAVQLVSAHSDLLDLPAEKANVIFSLCRQRRRSASDGEFRTSWWTSR